MNSSTYLLVVEESEESKKKGIGISMRRRRKNTKTQAYSNSIILIKDDEEAEEEDDSDTLGNGKLKYKSSAKQIDNENEIKYDDNGNIIISQMVSKTEERKQEEEMENGFMKNIMDGILTESNEQFEINDSIIKEKRNKLVLHCHQIIEQSEYSFNMPNFSNDDLQQILNGTFSVAKFQAMLIDSLFNKYDKNCDQLVTADSCKPINQGNSVNHKNCKFPIHRFSALIIGPNGSGKSTYFHTLVKETIDLFIKTKEWKGSICFSLDFMKAKIKEDSVFDLYNYLIEQTFKQITFHLPAFTPFESKIIQHFKQIPEQSKIPTLPKALRNEPDLIYVCDVLEKLTESLYKTIRRSDKMSEFFNIVASIPTTIVSAFGFDRIHFFIDHFDLADILVSACHPFGSSKCVFLIEVLKKMIAPHSFVLCCKDENKFLNLIGKTGDNSVDLFSGSKVVNTISLPFTAKNTTDYLLAEFDGTERTVRFGAEHCGGSFIYLAQWDAIVAKVLSRNKATPKEMCVLCDKARSLLRKIFDPDSIPSTHVNSLRKVK